MQGTKEEVSNQDRKYWKANQDRGHEKSSTRLYVFCAVKWELTDSENPNRAFKVSGAFKEWFSTVALPQSIFHA